jgi:hypothetical protein
VDLEQFNLVTEDFPENVVRQELLRIAGSAREALLFLSAAKTFKKLETDKSLQKALNYLSINPPDNEKDELKARYEKEIGTAPIVTQLTLRGSATDFVQNTDLYCLSDRTITPIEATLFCSLEEFPVSQFFRLAEHQVSSKPFDPFAL